MKKLKALLFDLDGTLLDTAPDFAVVVNQLRAEYDQPALPFELIRSTVSNGARGLVQLAFDCTPEDSQFKKYHTRLLELYENHLDVHSTLFPGMEELLDTIKANNMSWGIVTNKPYRYTAPLLKSFALLKEAATVVCPDHVSKTKPNPEPIHLACQQVECTPEEGIYIGDHKRDIEAGKNAGMPTIAALYGYIDDNENPLDWQADYNANTVEDIIEFIFEME